MSDKGVTRVLRPLLPPSAHPTSSSKVAHKYRSQDLDPTLIVGVNTPPCLPASRPRFPPHARTPLSDRSRSGWVVLTSPPPSGTQ